MGKSTDMDTVTKVAVCSRSFSKNPFLRDELLKSYSNVTFNDDGASLNGESLVAFLKGHQKAITALERIDSDLLSQLPDLKVIGKYGVGLDMFDFTAMDKYGVKLGWTAGVNKRSVAELVISFAINLLRGVHISNNEIKSGIWRQYKGEQLSSTTVGILGCGNVGKEVVRLLKAFGTRVLVCDIKDYPDFYSEYDVEVVALEQLLSDSDLLSVHIPLNEENRNFIDLKKLNLLKKGAFLINTSRGNIVDEKVVLDKLKNGDLAAVAFDVFAEEPAKEMELINMPNFLSTPHIGGSSNQAIIAMGKAAIEGLDNYKSASEYLE